MFRENLGSLLYQCCRTKAFRHGTSLHAVVIKTGRLSIITSNHILNMYAKCGKLGLAQQIFEEMTERNIVTWSALISGNDQAGNPLAAVNIFMKMRSELLPNEFIFASVLNSCASLQMRRLGQEIHALSLKSGCYDISFVSNSLMSLYMKLGDCSDAISVFTEASVLSTVSYNSLITGLVDNGQPDEGFQMFKVMCRAGLMPDCFTFLGVLGTCVDLDDLWRGLQLHCQTVKLMLDSVAVVGNVLMTMYTKFSMIETVEKVFRLIQKKDVISWNTIIASFSQCGEHVKALAVFREMENEVLVRPDVYSYASVLSASAGLASIRHGKQIHAHLMRTRPYLDAGVVNALVNMYAKCGCVEYAYIVFIQMGGCDAMSWNSIIVGFANNGLGERAIEMFNCMVEAGIKPDSITFLGLLTACNHVGLVDAGKDYFNLMEPVYSLMPAVEHVSCLIDLLGRAGRLVEAEEYVQKYNFGHNPVVLGCLLSASRLHGDVVTGERIANRLLKLQPGTTSPYVLLSNLYASDKMWVDAAKARKMLKESGLKKEAGYSLIDVNGYVHIFTIGDFSFWRMDEMINLLATFKFKFDDELVF